MPFDLNPCDLMDADFVSCLSQVRDVPMRADKFENMSWQSITEVGCSGKCNVVDITAKAQSMFARNLKEGSVKIAQYQVAKDRTGAGSRR